MDLDLHKVSYFAAVAEHLNFGRAAESLHIAQPVLSRQIRGPAQPEDLTRLLLTHLQVGTAIPMCQMLPMMSSYPDCPSDLMPRVWLWRG
jgi:hypothetical protein